MRAINVATVKISVNLRHRFHPTRHYVLIELDQFPAHLEEFVVYTLLFGEVSLANKPNYRAPWTATDDNQLIELLAAGRSIPEIASHLGRSQEAVATLLEARSAHAKRKVRREVSAQRTLMSAMGR